MADRGGKRPGAGRKIGAVSQQKKDLAELARTHTEKALEVLVKIATDGESEAARVSAATAILDRGYGKPGQSVSIGNPDGTALGPNVIQIVPVPPKHGHGSTKAP